MKASVIRCRRCVLSANFPRITFDDDGVCNYCKNEFTAGMEEREIEKSRAIVSELIGASRGRFAYDAIVCYSGGKDSTYTLQLTVRKYGMKALAFTFDNGFMSPEALLNIQHVCDTLGVDHITVRPSPKNMRAIIAASVTKPVYNPKTLTRISSGCNSCISIVNMTALKMALEKNIPFIVAGFTLGQIPANSIVFRHTYHFLQESRLASLAVLRREAGDFIDDYFSIHESTLSSGKDFSHTLNLLCLEKITEREIIEAIIPLGWTSPKDVDGCSSNCRLNVFNNFAHERRFGYSPYELELSQLVRKGLMSREEAIGKLEDQPAERLEEIMKELNIRESDLLGLGR
jgi:tRNA(Ile)-lysidine synthase TilS/MesJ